MFKKKHHKQNLRIVPVTIIRKKTRINLLPFTIASLAPKVPPAAGNGCFFYPFSLFCKMAAKLLMMCKIHFIVSLDSLDWRIEVAVFKMREFFLY